MRKATHDKRLHGDAGVAVVEMALVGTLLVFLLFGIVVFGYLMSFRQSMTQAAAEATRAGAVAPAGGTNAQVAARNAATQAVSAFGQTCGSGGMTCDVPVPAPCVNNTAATCITVTLTFDYVHHKLLPDIPLIGQFIPETFESKSVAEINT